MRKLPGARHGRTLIASMLALGLGLLVAALAATGAAASQSWSWSTYNLSSEAGGQLSAGRPGLLVDPQGGDQQAVVNDPGGGTDEFGGDGAAGAKEYPVSSWAGGPAGSGGPVGIKDPQNGEFLIFTDTGSGDLESYERNASSYAWRAWNITSLAGGQTISGDPSVTVVSNLLQVATDSANGHLIVFSRAASGAWSSTDVSAVTGQTIAGSPTAVTDPGGYLEIVAQNSAGHYIAFALLNGSWWSQDMTASFGGQTIAGQPAVVFNPQNQQMFMFTNAPGGNLIQWTRNGDGTWTSENVTALTGGPTIGGDPAVVFDPSDNQFFVVAQGAHEQLIAYQGSGASWSASNLTSADNGPTVAADPAVTLSAHDGNLAVFATSGANDLVELERSAAPAPASGTDQSSATSTQSQATVTPPPSTPSAKRKAVRIAVGFTWRWSRTQTRLHALKLKPKLVRGSRMSWSCAGSHCPWKRLSAGWGHITALEKRVERSVFRPGELVHLQLSEPDRTPERVRIAFPRHGKPRLKLL